MFTLLTEAGFTGWAVVEWECCVKSPEQGAAEGRTVCRPAYHRGHHGCVRRLCRHRRRCQSQSSTAWTGVNHRKKVTCGKLEAQIAHGDGRRRAGTSIGGVHRLCAAMDGQIELVAGCFSRATRRPCAPVRSFILRRTHCYTTYQEMATRRSRLATQCAHRFCQYCDAECFTLRYRPDISEGRLSRRVR